MQLTNGVPFVVVPPEHERPESPVVVAWHLADPPRSETAMAAALPLAGLDAWRVYLGLPMHSSRSIDPDEYMRLAYEDAVVNHFGPITAQARAEFPAAYAELADRFGFSGPLALLGGSLGSAVAQLVADRPGRRRRRGARQPGRHAAFDRGRERAPLRRHLPLAPGGHEDRRRARFRRPRRRDHGAASRSSSVTGTTRPSATRAADLAKALRHADLVTVPDMPHELADPDERPLPHAATVDGLAVEWLRRHLP